MYVVRSLAAASGNCTILHDCKYLKYIEIYECGNLIVKVLVPIFCNLIRCGLFTY